MKAMSEPTENMIQWIGVIVICMIMLYVIMTWASSGAMVQTSIEQASLMYTIASSANALSTSDSGQVVRTLRAYYDIDVSCSGSSCSVATAAYDQSGKLLGKSDPVTILAKIAPVSMKKVNKVTLTKSGDSITLTGEQTENLFGTELTIKQYSPMCFNDVAKFRDSITQASAKYGVDKELISAFIISESEPPWNLNSYRYEPGFQVRNLEGSSWTSSPYWIKPGDEGAITIRQWFDQHPDRQSEMSSLTSSQLDLIAQTRISASYGLMQTLYTTAFESCGFRGEPEGLYDPGMSIDCGTKIIKANMDKYTLADAVSAYNAGTPAWTTNAANKEYTEKVLGLYNAFRACTA
jgi:hypothetical protein